MNPTPKPQTKRLKGKAYAKFRREVAIRAGFHCEDCCVYASLVLAEGGFNPYFCGHVSHIKSRGSGGGDTMDNVKWKCWDCHTKEHGPRWSKGGGDENI